ncbi:MAG TPA: glycosyltransferase family 4 protein [Tenuifilaceae bacterium]|nr:glycosyltransferase family 4 protein [Tenuifilaceae bacterium]
MTIVIVILLLACIVSFTLAAFIRRMAIRLRLMNESNARSLHSGSIPIGGGLAIIAVWYIGTAVFFWLGFMDKSLFYALLCGLVLAGVSLLDDIIQVKPIIRLIVHFGVATASLYLLGGLRKPVTPGIDILSIPAVINPLAVVGMVWFINLYNFMDGADGFASVEAISIALVLFAFTGSMELLLLVSAVLGFLYWNWPKAKIFMGDVGSTQLGFILVVLGINYHNTLDFSIFNWLMISSPFWFDATLTLFRRWRNKEKLSEAHRKHTYQRFIQAGYSHKELDLALIFFNGTIFLMILVYREFEIMKIPITLFTLGILYYFTRRVDRLFPFAKD